MSHSILRLFPTLISKIKLKNSGILGRRGLFSTSYEWPARYECLKSLFRDHTGSHYRCLVCGAGFRTDGSFQESIKNGLCYLGDHTTQSEAVEYRETGGAAITCVENRCFRVFFV